MNRPESDSVMGRDCFVVNPPQRPKEKIAEYVEKQGILVPRRFNSLADALNSKKSFIIRSEDPTQYAGPSGIVKSLVVTPERIAGAQLFLKNESDRFTFNWKTHLPNSEKDKTETEKFIESSILVHIGTEPQKVIEKALRNLSHQLITRYTHYAEVDEDTFDSGISFSYWEYLPGTNFTVSADSTILDRYHFIFNPDGVQGDYVFFDENEIQADIRPEILQALDLYKSVRNLPQFNSDHCPLIEMQFHEGEMYFLQYHRGRDFAKAEFTLEREKEPDEFEAAFVRGSTPLEGIICDTTLFYNYGEGGFLVVPPENASFDLHFEPQFSESCARKRVAQFCYGGLEKLKINLSKDHLSRSLFFKPGVFCALKSADMKTMMAFARKKRISSIRLRVVSDGKKAYVKIVD